MDIARWSIERPLYPWLIIICCLGAGWYGMNTVGRLEDPVFDFGMAMVVTPYPGATAEEVEQEVTDVLEAAIQELPQLDKLNSKSVPGRSEIQLQLYPEYMDARMPQVWDELRRRVGEAELKLPPGAGPTIVEDDFGDVFGIVYAVSTPGYSPAEARDIANMMARRLKLIYGVAKISVTGLPEEAIFVELDRERLGRFGLPVEQLFTSISVENKVLRAGSISVDGRRLRIRPPPGFNSVQEVGELQVGLPGSTEFVRLGDIATIVRETVENPSHLIRHDGELVFTIGVSVVRQLNVVDVGQRVDEGVEAILKELPLGVTVEPVYRQHKVVEQSINSFLENLAISIVTVIGALCLFMGWRAGAVVGSVLFLTIFGTIGMMSIFGIELQRISLGALMIAMGMLVDNAIVVADGMVVGTRQGLSSADAASRSVKRTQYALLGATVIGILAFAPIGLSDDESGKFQRSLIQVVFISLMLSWVLAVTVVPLLGNYLLRSSTEVKTAYQGWMFQPYRSLMKIGLRRGWLTSLILAMITLACLYSAGFVKQGFFPFASTPIFFVNYYLPQGSDINTTSQEVERIEHMILDDPEVISATTFIGQGATRFMLVTQPEQPNPAYAQVMIRVTDLDVMADVMKRVEHQVPLMNPDAEIQVFRTSFTSSGTSLIEARFSGPDPEVLRSLGEQTLAVYLDHDLIDRKLNWRQPELTIVPYLDEARARIAGIDRQHVASTLAYASEGVRIGTYREDDKQIPIIARAPETERLDINGWGDRDIWSPSQQKRIPASQIVKRVALEPENTLVYRRQRIRTLSAQANPPTGHNTGQTQALIQGEIESIPLPPGYSLAWGGEHEASQRASEMLAGKIPTTFGLMFLITVLMFGTLKQPIVIWLTIPMSVCGVVLALLVTDMTLTFPAFLGFLSLSGMLIKNCIILVDEIDKRMAEEPVSEEMIREASVSRLRPVLLAAGTTIAGMAPLLRDVFFAEMAVTIMGGLAFATVLTLIAAPVFYRLALQRQISEAAGSTLKTGLS